MPRKKNNEVREIPEKEKLLASEIYKKFKDLIDIKNNNFETIQKLLGYVLEKHINRRTCICFTQCFNENGYTIW